jgi:hypothetical protein
MAHQWSLLMLLLIDLNKHTVSKSGSKLPHSKEVRIAPGRQLRGTSRR